MTPNLSAASGVLVVDKPRGPTSHDIVAQARRLFSTRRIGHAGTLDPAATGVLLLMVGEASKLSNYLAGEHKTYLAEIAFGMSTDTLDAEGKQTESRDISTGWLNPIELELALEAERGRTSQVPPSYSAIKSGGQVAHKAARRGEIVTLCGRDIRVRSLQLMDQSDFKVSLIADVSKGYYVRALARDLGERLGMPAHLSALRRLSSGAFTLDEARRWPPTPTALPPLIPVLDVARRCLKIAHLSPDGEARASVGKPLEAVHFTQLPSPMTEGAPFGWEFEQRLVAIGKRSGDEYRVARGFNRPQQG